ncbi:MAG: hypothetical protein R3178_01870 [Rhodothermales bacterium]|nr:hypothetical protein [Rhodothermales bacterium]
MDILFLALLALAGIPAAIMVSMLVGQCIGGAANCIADFLSFLRHRRHAGA